MVQGACSAAGTPALALLPQGTKLAARASSGIKARVSPHHTKTMLKKSFTKVVCLLFVIFILSQEKRKE